MVPDISLTRSGAAGASSTQGAGRILHSQLTELERAQQWWRTRRGDAEVVLGSRSAVFAPIPRLGLICLDEEDRPPTSRIGRRATRRLGRARLAEVSGARLVAGSATPSVVTYHDATQASWRWRR